MVDDRREAAREITAAAAALLGHEQGGQLGMADFGHIDRRLNDLERSVESLHARLDAGAAFFEPVFPPVDEDLLENIDITAAHHEMPESYSINDLFELPDVVMLVKKFASYLREPQQYAGIQLPKMLLLFGPSGTGKTHIAKTIAKEAGLNIALLEALGENSLIHERTGHDITLQRTFAFAFRNPCVMIIQKIERLSADRFCIELRRMKKKSFLLVATTSDFTRAKKMLDALNNSFYKVSGVPLPLIPRREKLLRHWLRDVTWTDKEFKQLTALTFGFSVHELKATVDGGRAEAAFFKSPLNLSFFQIAYGSVLRGVESAERITIMHEKWHVAAHEGAHAFISVLLTDAEPVQFVSVLPTPDALGQTFTLPRSDERMVNKAKLFAEIQCWLAGAICEKMYFADDRVTTGCANDLNEATKLATDAVDKYGFSELGLMATVEGIENGPARKDQKDREVAKIIDECAWSAECGLRENQKLLNKLIFELFHRECLFYEDVQKIVSGLELD